MIIRRAEASDSGALASLEERLFRPENYPLSRRAFYYHIRRNLLLVARSEAGALAGYILVLITRREPKLYSLGVSPDFERRGIASELLTGALREVESRGYGHTWLEVRCDNETALRLYRRFGFQTVKTLPGFYRDGADGYLMRR